MPLSKCCVCGEDSRKGQGASFFRIPTDNRRETWLKFIRKFKDDQQWEAIKSSRICCRHFLKDSFERNPLVQIQNIEWKKILTKTAVPTVFGPIRSVISAQVVSALTHIKNDKTELPSTMNAIDIMYSANGSTGSQVGAAIISAHSASAQAGRQVLSALTHIKNDKTELPSTMNAIDIMYSANGSTGSQVGAAIMSEKIEHLRSRTTNTIDAEHSATISSSFPVESSLGSVNETCGLQKDIEISSTHIESNSYPLHDAGHHNLISTDIDVGCGPSEPKLRRIDGICQQHDCSTREKVNRYEICALKTQLANNLAEQEKSKQQLLDNLEAQKQQMKSVGKKHTTELRSLKAGIERTQKLLDDERKKNKDLKKDLAQGDIQSRKHRREILKLQKKIAKKKNSNSNILPHVKKLLSSTLTPNQIDLIVKKKKRVRWTKQELSTAFTLRYFGISAYDFLRSGLNYPLPSVSTLRRYAAKLNLKEGCLLDVIKMLKTAGANKTERERVTVLSFDEMKVKEVYEMDSADDEVIGPHRYLQVVMARGLFDKWKTPVYVGFDTNMTSELLNQIITHLHEASYPVVACVSDMGSSNLGLWSQLGVSYLRPYFCHPVTKEKITMFADAPHLLKLIRNWLLQSGNDKKLV